MLSRKWQNCSDVKLWYCGGLLLCLTRQVAAEEAGWALEFCKCWEGMGSRLSASASALLPSWSASQAEGPHAQHFQCSVGCWSPACIQYGETLFAEVAQMQQEKRVAGS